MRLPRLALKYEYAHEERVLSPGETFKCVICGVTYGDAGLSRFGYLSKYGMDHVFVCAKHHDDAQALTRHVEEQTREL